MKTIQDISKSRINDLDQLNTNAFFVQRKLCKYIINNTFAASISLEDKRTNNNFKSFIVNIKRLNYYGH